MNVYLAGFNALARQGLDTSEVFLLSSFWEHKSGKFHDYVYQERHILDSGAFTAINDKKGQYKDFNWEEYLKKYIAFIKHTNQKLFFELDIDCVKGLEKVEYYRKTMEDAIGIPPIPVWHASRGFEYFEKMCQDYPYVSIGSSKIIYKRPDILKKFINVAHENNAKIHCLGFTSTPLLKNLPFDSVDSTTWISGIKFGETHVFQNGMIKTHRRPGQRGIGGTKVLLHNYNEWVKYQQYAIKNL